MLDRVLNRPHDIILSLSIITTLSSNSFNVLSVISESEKFLVLRDWCHSFLQILICPLSSINYHLFFLPRLSKKLGTPAGLPLSTWFMVVSQHNVFFEGLIWGKIFRPFVISQQRKIIFEFCDVEDAWYRMSIRVNKFNVVNFVKSF